MDGITTSLVLLAVAWAVALLALWPLARLMSPRRAQERFQPSEQASLPDITVVVFCDRDSEGLVDVVAAIKRQKYPGNRKIILAVDPTSRALADTVKQVQHFNPEIYVTTVPEDTRNVSRRKLAIYLGVKAAKTDEIVFVNSQTKILGDDWLASVAAAFTPDTDIIVGPVKPESVPGATPARWLRTVDYALTALTWLAAALRGHCYRGDSANLAYRKSRFFANNGFAASLNLHYGDDDIFLSEISRKGKAVVNVNPDGSVAVKPLTAWEWEERMRRRRFTMRGLGKGPRFLTSSLTFLAWVNLTAGILGIVFASTDLLFILLSAYSLVTFITLTIVMLKKAMKFLKIKCPAAAIYPALLLRPVLTLGRIAVMRGEKDKNYTWQRLK